MSTDNAPNAEPGQGTQPAPQPARQSIHDLQVRIPTDEPATQTDARPPVQTPSPTQKQPDWEQVARQQAQRYEQLQSQTTQQLQAFQEKLQQAQAPDALIDRLVNALRPQEDPYEDPAIRALKQEKEQIAQQLRQTTERLDGIETWRREQEERAFQAQVSGAVGAGLKAVGDLTTEQRDVIHQAVMTAVVARHHQGEPITPDWAAETVKRYVAAFRAQPAAQPQGQATQTPHLRVVPGGQQPQRPPAVPQMPPGPVGAGQGPKQFTTFDELDKHLDQVLRANGL